jgi:phosphodiesterase/alkaline phosphatase D-like protein
MSGDPAPRAITLWTRLANADGAGTVELELARDRGFRRVVARELVRTSERSAHSVKARVAGLRPHEEYWYRFSTRGEESPIGRFRTAPPADSREPVRFAFFSCKSYGFGYFNAHTLLAAEDVDFVINLGDYIYAEADYAAGDGNGGVRTDPVGLAETLGQCQMALSRSGCPSRTPPWKVIANLVMVMPTIYPGGRYIGFDSWQGYPRERRALLRHLRRGRIEDVVFVTGDIHTFVAGDVRVDPDDRSPVATEVVGGSVTSPGLGEGRGGVLPGADPTTRARRRRSSTCCAARTRGRWTRTSTTTATAWYRRAGARWRARCAGSTRSSARRARRCRTGASPIA